LGGKGGFSKKKQKKKSFKGPEVGGANTKKEVWGPQGDAITSERHTEEKRKTQSKGGTTVRKTKD